MPIHSEHCELTLEEEVQDYYSEREYSDEDRVNAFQVSISDEDDVRYEQEKMTKFMEKYCE